MKFVSWNVNGLRSCIRKGFTDYVAEVGADFVCLQEIKLQAGQLEHQLDPAYTVYWNYAQKKGYSGTAILAKQPALGVYYGIEENYEPEGRIITLEYASFFLVTVYTPNAKRDLSRLDERLVWEDRFRSYLQQLHTRKPVVVCGDLNVAHEEIDIKNARANRNNSGFTEQERDKMSRLLASGFVDSFRHLHADASDAYTWWSNMPGVRERNVGWRIDYFLISQSLAKPETLAGAGIDSHVYGSDHCPITLELNLSLD